MTYINIYTEQSVCPTAPLYLSYTKTDWSVAYLGHIGNFCNPPSNQAVKDHVQSLHRLFLLWEIGDEKGAGQWDILLQTSNWLGCALDPCWHCCWNRRHLRLTGYPPSSCRWQYSSSGELFWASALLASLLMLISLLFVQNTRYPISTLCFF